MSAKSRKKDSGGKSSRKFKNFLLMPHIQIPLGAYMIGLAIALLGVLTSIVYLKMGEIISLIVQLTDVEEEVEEVLINYVNDMSWWVILAIVIYIGINMLISILYTHKMVGPIFAFRRHVQALIEQKYDAKTHLRKRDAFSGLAQDLNDLSDALAKRDSPTDTTIDNGQNS